MSRKLDKTERAIVAIGFTVILVVILGLTFTIRRYAPCWVFPLREAPTRCLPGGHL